MLRITGGDRVTIEQGDVLRITASWLQDGLNQMQNVFTIRATGDPGSTQADIISDLKDWIDDIYQEIKVIMNNTITDDFISIYNITKDVLEHVGAFSTSITGTSSGDAMPNGVAPFGYARTSQKRRRGSKFFPASSESTQATGLLTVGGLTALVAGLAQWISDHTGALTGALFEPGIWSNVPGIGDVFLVFLNAVARAQLGYQRRRKPGVGA